MVTKRLFAHLSEFSAQLTDAPINRSAAIDGQNLGLSGHVASRSSYPPIPTNSPLPPAAPNTNSHRRMSATAESLRSSTFPANGSFRRAPWLPRKPGFRPRPSVLLSSKTNVIAARTRGRSNRALKNIAYARGRTRAPARVAGKPRKTFSR